MNCEVCFKPTTGRRCAKHPETKPDMPYKEVRENPLLGLQCRIEELEAEREPCYYQEISNDMTEWETSENLTEWDKPLTPEQERQSQKEIRKLIKHLKKLGYVEIPATPTQFQQGR